MNFKLFTIPCTLIVVISLLLTACSKEGPAGPAGPAGTQGQTGPTGPQGPKGDTGTANVIYSDWLDVTYKPDTVHNGTKIDTIGFSAQINAPKLTNDILSNGEIKVYVNAGTAASPLIIPLPIYEPFLVGVIINTYFQVGKIALIATDDAGTFTTTSNQKAWQYRYILIPGGTPAGTQAGGIIKKVNWNNYTEVKSYLKLKD